MSTTERLQRIQLLYNLTFQTPFHCGTGLSSGLIDRTIVRDAEGYLYIPGSTIKGALRMQCERLSHLYEDDEDMRERIDSPHNPKKALWGVGNKATMVTRIFGYQQRPGSLFFDDARQDDQEKDQYDSKDRDGKGRYLRLQTDLYTQVRLHHPSQTAVSGALYTSEFGTRNFSFKGSIIGGLECFPIESLQRVPTHSLLLLLTGLHLLDRLGGNKSTGKGLCRFEITQLLINGTPYQDTQWKTWLDSLDALSDYSMYEASREEG